MELSKSGVKVAGGKGKGKANPLKEAMEKFAREGGTQEETEQRANLGLPHAEAATLASQVYLRN